MAGIPQIIVPIAFDQPDNAARMERLGVGLQISRNHFNGRRLADTLHRLLQESAYQEKAQAISRRMDGPAAVTTACDLIEKTLRRAP